MTTPLARYRGNRRKYRNRRASAARIGSAYRVIITGTLSQQEIKATHADSPERTTTLGPFAELKSEAVPHLLSELELWKTLNREVTDYRIEGAYFEFRTVTAEATDALLDWKEREIEGNETNPPRFSALFEDQVAA